MSISEKLLLEIYKDAGSPAVKSGGSWIRDIADATRFRLTRNVQLDAINQRLLDRIKESVQDIPLDL